MEQVNIDIDRDSFNISNLTEEQLKRFLDNIKLLNESKEEMNRVEAAMKVRTINDM